MDCGYRVKHTELYKGFVIKFCTLGTLYTEYWRIFKDDENITVLALYSAKAARNVIDTYLKRTGSVIPA